MKSSISLQNKVANSEIVASPSFKGSEELNDFASKTTDSPSIFPSSYEEPGYFGGTGLVATNGNGKGVKFQNSAPVTKSGFIFLRVPIMNPLIEKGLKGANSIPMILVDALYLLESIEIKGSYDEIFHKRFYDKVNLSEIQESKRLCYDRTKHLTRGSVFLEILDRVFSHSTAKVYDTLFMLSVLHAHGLRAKAYKKRDIILDGIKQNKIIISNSSSTTDEGMIAFKLFHKVIAVDSKYRDVHKLRTLELEEEIMNEKLYYLFKLLMNKGLEGLDEVKQLLADLVMKRVEVLPYDFRPAMDFTKAKHTITLIYDKIFNASNFETNGSHLTSRVSSSIDTLESILSKFLASSDNQEMARTVQNTKYNGGLITIPSMLTAKEGYIRSTALKQRTDMSGRAVIGVNFNLKINEVGIPEKALISAFYEIILRDYKKDVYGSKSPTLKEWHYKHNQLKFVQFQKTWIKNLVDKGLYTVIGRQPTLHLLSIQAFKVVPVKGKTLCLHPLNTSAFNADFDGDQMHFSFFLGEESNRELREVMLSSKNLFWPRQGKIQHLPKQEMVYAYYKMLTLSPTKQSVSLSTDLDKVLRGITNKEIHLGSEINQLSVAKYVLLEVLRAGGVDQRHLAILRAISSGKVSNAIENAIQDAAEKAVRDNNYERYIIMHDRLLKLVQAVLCAYPINISILQEDTIQIENIDKVLEPTYIQLAKLERKGLITADDYNKLLKLKYDDIVNAESNKLASEMRQKGRNGFYILASSGTKGSKSDWTQLYLNKGFVQKDSRSSFQQPIESSLIKGMSSMEQMMAAYGARQGIVDKSVNTYRPGELTTHMINLCQRETITVTDCGSTDGLEISKRLLRFHGSTTSVADNDEILQLLKHMSPSFINRTFILEDGSQVKCDSKEAANALVGRVINGEAIKMRSPIYCNCPTCKTCYGHLLHTGKDVPIGTNIGFIAATSVTEPATQLSMKSFQAGGVVSEGSLMSNFDWLERYLVNPSTKHKNSYLTLSAYENLTHLRTQPSLEGQKQFFKESRSGNELMLISQGTQGVRSSIKKGEPIISNQGKQYIGDIIALRGLRDATAYLVYQLYTLFSQQGVTINIKHFEVIVSSMLQYKVIVPGAEYGNILTRKEMLNKGIQSKDVVGSIYGATDAVHNRANFLEIASYQRISENMPNILLNHRDFDIDSPLMQAMLGVPVESGNNIYDKYIEEY